MKALLVYPTHENGREVCQDCCERELNAVCYPGRNTDPTSGSPVNCWNKDADRAEALGFPVVQTVCPVCPENRQCRLAGYLRQMNEAKRADVVISTHKRAEHMGLAELAQGREYVSIHEDPVTLLRPRMTITESDLSQALFVMDRITNDPYYLQWFASALRKDADGREYEDEELLIRKERWWLFCLLLFELIDELSSAVANAEQTTSWEPTKIQTRPTGIERTLFRATQRERATFYEPAWRFLLTAATGDLASAAIIVDRRHTTGSQQPVDVRKTVIGIRDNRPPSSSTVWFNDATIEPERLQAILQHPVTNQTPKGYLPLQRKAVQLPRDVTRRTSRKIVANLIRGVLVDRLQFQRVGVIAHRPHLKALDQLGTMFADRIVKSTYFGSGDERSSNDWHHQCDLILVVGTPRIPHAAIAEYLVQVGDLNAACQNGEWDALDWRGQTESGDEIKVASRGYHNDAWRQAQRELVRAQLRQAIGRGRGVLETGCEVLVLSTEECGLVISDVPVEPINETSLKILEYLHGLTIQNPNIYLLEKRIVSTREIAQSTGLCESYLRRQLQTLERRGLVHKVGERKGWLPVVVNTPVASATKEVA